MLVVDRSAGAFVELEDNSCNRTIDHNMSILPLVVVDGRVEGP